MIPIGNKKTDQDYTVGWDINGTAITEWLDWFISGPRRCKSEDEKFQGLITDFLSAPASLEPKDYETWGIEKLCAIVNHKLSEKNIDNELITKLKNRVNDLKLITRIFKYYYPNILSFTLKRGIISPEKACEGYRNTLNSKEKSVTTISNQLEIILKILQEKGDNSRIKDLLHTTIIWRPREVYAIFNSLPNNLFCNIAKAIIENQSESQSDSSILKAFYLYEVMRLTEKQIPHKDTFELEAEARRRLLLIVSGINSEQVTPFITLFPEHYDLAVFFAAISKDNDFKLSSLLVKDRSFYWKHIEDNFPGFHDESFGDWVFCNDSLKQALIYLNAIEKLANSGVWVDSYKIEESYKWLIQLWPKTDFTELTRDINKKKNHIKEIVGRWLSYTLALCREKKLSTDQMQTVVETAPRIIKHSYPQFRYFLSQFLVDLVTDKEGWEHLRSLNDKASKHTRLPNLFLSRLLTKGINRTCVEQCKNHISTNRDFRDPKKMKFVLEFLKCIVDRDEDDISHLLGYIFNGKTDAVISKIKYVTVFFEFGKVWTSDLPQYPTINSEDDLSKILLEWYKKKLDIDHIENFEKKFNDTLAKFRNIHALIKFVNNCSGGKQFVISVLEGTFLEKRYQIKGQLHLETVFSERKDMLEKWKKGMRISFIDALTKQNWSMSEINVYHGYHVVVSDDPGDLVLSGTEVRNSCLDIYDRGGGYERYLLANIKDGKTKILAIKDNNEKIVARCVVRILWDSKNNTPVLFLEPNYPKGTNKILKEALLNTAKKQAKILGIQLLSKKLGTGRVYKGTVESLSNPIGKELTDSANVFYDGETDGTYTIVLPQYVE